MTDQPELGGGSLRSIQHPGENCGTCKHSFPDEYNDKFYWKCDLKNVTRGAGSDIRKKWAACHKWEPRDGRKGT